MRAHRFTIKELKEMSDNEILRILVNACVTRKRSVDDLDAMVMRSRREVEK